MISFRSRTPSDRPTIDPQPFRAVMSRPAIVREFFLPIEQAWWDGGRYTLGRWLAQTPRPNVTGVRLQEPRSADAGVLPERDTQHDLCALVRSVAELRKTPELSGLVLSEETLVGTQSGTIPGKRLVFGLSCPADGRFKGESAAVKECHRVVKRSVQRAGFVVEHPTAPFNPAGGFAGLLDWAGAVRLRRKKPKRLWLLLLLLPLLLLPWACQSSPTGPATMFGVTVEEESFIILLDKSGSMEQYLAQIRNEARNLLEERSRSPDKLHYADLIVYDARTESVLNGLQPVTPERIAKITTYLDQLKIGGWTKLDVAIKLAAEEVVRHGRKTTLLVLTDGEDKTIKPMIKDHAKVRALFKGVPITIHATTPRLFAAGADPRPATDDERDLAEFCKLFNGRFGPTRAVP